MKITYKTSQQHSMDTMAVTTDKGTLFVAKRGGELTILERQASYLRANIDGRSLGEMRRDNPEFRFSLAKGGAQ
jgi:hypothetical protein